MKYIYHHLGLGDHIICNGLVRYYCELYGEVSVFCKPHNFTNVSYMYRDNYKIKVLPIGEDSDVNNFILTNNIHNNTIVCGFGRASRPKFDEEFYASVNLPFDYRFSKFFLLRDYEKENNILNTLNPTGEPYIFVHGVNKSKVRTDLKIIENPVQYNLFDILTLIENSTEVHLMESSVKNLVNSIKIDKPKFFYHQYSRGYPDFNNSQGLNKFETI
jgi:hypothetical protein